MDECSYTYAPFRAALAGRQLKTMLEIGSLHGLDAIEVMKTYALERVLTIECNPECIEICRKNFAPYPNISLVEVAAWHTDGTIPFYRVVESKDYKGASTHNIGASSCFQTNDSWPYEKYTQEKIEVPARRLDGVLSNLKIETVDLICMDAQGAELYALQGLGDYLKGVQAIITELELDPMYHDQTLFEDVRRFLEGQGFALAVEHRWAKSAGDFLFMRPAVRPANRPTEAPVSTRPESKVAPAYTAEDGMLACKVALHQAGMGQSHAAKIIMEAVDEHFPKLFLAAVVRGQIAEHRREFPAAIRAYEYASELNPGHALPFTRRALLKFRLAYGDPPAPQPIRPGAPFVGLPSLGSAGRFGNQLLQYGMLRLYAERSGAQALAPDWIGRDLFGCNEALPSNATATRTLDDAAVIAVLAGRTRPPPTKVDLAGYFCGDVREWASARPKFQRLFEPSARVRTFADRVLHQVMARGKTLVAVHIRHGDYGQGKYWIAPTAWYLRWLQEIWPTLDKPVLYLASDDSTVMTELSAFNPTRSSDLGEPLAGVEFFADHWILRHAEYLATSNSTFSGTAALLNQRMIRTVRPDPSIQGLRPFDPWAEKVLLD